MHIKNGSSTPVYEVDLLISLDGKTSSRYPFTGTFNGTTLKQNGEGLIVDLTFTRTDGSDGTTASCSGTITLPGKSSVSVEGSTYNNPIRSSLFNGVYYGSVPLYVNGIIKHVTMPVLKIEDYQISYDYGINGGALQPVTTYTYNMNMYFFSFKQGSDSVSFIMGTAAAGGLACNNMIADAARATSRSLQTIQSPDQANLVFPNLKSNDLAAFSGYYQIPSIAPGAFVSIQAEYANVIGDDYIVLIGVSMDGVTSKGYYFEEAKMTFENNVLIMPDQSISITFNREYNQEQRSLVTITGTVGNHKNVTGSTLFNPVPLLAFGGVPMTNNNTPKDSLTVVSKNKVVYNGETMEGIIYVPLMYILAYPWNKPTIVMSFGTDGLKGNTCIVTDLTVNPPKISVVYAIPD